MELIQSLLKKYKTALVVTGLIFISLIILYGLKYDLFSSPVLMRDFIESFGILAPVVFILFLISQVVFPIIPAAVNLLAGIFIFGPIFGFIYNYIGVVIGSILAFFISRHYGLALIKRVTPRKTFEKYVGWIQKPDFERLFAVAIFFPVAPDDLLCYLAGSSKMKFRKFLIILLLGKIIGVITYTLGIKFVILRLLTFLKF